MFNMDTKPVRCSWKVIVLINSLKQKKPGENTHILGRVLQFVFSKVRLLRRQYSDLDAAKIFPGKYLRHISAPAAKLREGWVCFTHRLAPPSLHPLICCHRPPRLNGLTDDVRQTKHTVPQDPAPLLENDQWGGSILWIFIIFRGLWGSRGRFARKVTPGRKEKKFLYKRQKETHGTMAVSENL